VIARIGASQSHRRLALALAASLCALAYGGLHASPARAAFGIASFDGTVTDQNGNPFTQAGGHPYDVMTKFTFTTGSNGKIEQNVKDIQVELPPGLVGDPSATPKCTFDELDNGQCPASAQVGTLVLDIPSPFTTKVYNMVPPAGEPAQFAANVLTASAVIDVSIRTGGDYGLTTTLTNIPTALPIYGSTLTFFGIPADQNGGGAPRTPFLTLPTACSGPQTTTLRVDTWQDPGDFQGQSFQSHDNSGNPIGASGCNGLAFNPSLTVGPDTAAADSPAGVSVDLHIPQNDAPDGVATAQLKNAIVTLPAGVSLNPAAADGLQACGQSQIGLDNASEPTCPDASKIGQVEIDSPLIADPLTGGIYLAQQDDNPFGSLLAIYVVAEADGVLIKLAGDVAADPVTGQLTATFSNTPQLPFSDFKLDFKGGSRAPLATPDGLGTYTATSSLTPWSAPDSGPPATPSSAFPITSGAISGFSPSFTAGVANPQAGAFSPFVLSFSRSDSDQYLSGLSVQLPDGMLAKLGGVPLCPDVDASAGACPPASQVGGAEVRSGAGSSPISLPGNVYMTGPYKGAPYGLAVVVPAVAGPFNLGTVVVRQALFIDPETAQVTVVSDPFPTILDGIPLRIRQINVDLNRPGFTLNPTSCAPGSVTGTLSSTGGLSENVSSRFQVGGCQELGFSPKLQISLSGKGRTRSGDHPALAATLTDPSGQANIDSAKVTLPLSLALDPNNSNNVCSPATAQAVHGGAVGCPGSTVVGSATVVTPLLSQPLSGTVYLVQGIRLGAGGQQIHTLPSLLIALRGQIALDLRAQTSVSGGKLVTTFGSIPDAPVSKFTLQINGGPKGLLVITGRGLNICTKAQVANANLGAQSGATKTQNMTVGTPCGKPAALRVVSRQIKAGALVLRVRASERGRLTVTGPGVRHFSRVVSAGLHQVQVALTQKARGATGVTMTLSPANAAPASRSFTMRR
jgi:hypothetical protein